jgi:hypothetical protein
VPVHQRGERRLVSLSHKSRNKKSDGRSFISNRKLPPAFEIRNQIFKSFVTHGKTKTLMFSGAR